MSTSTNFTWFCNIHEKPMAEMSHMILYLIETVSLMSAKNGAMNWWAQSFLNMPSGQWLVVIEEGKNRSWWDQWSSSAHCLLIPLLTNCASARLVCSLLQLILPPLQINLSLCVSLQATVCCSFVKHQIWRCLLQSSVLRLLHLAMLA